MPSSPRGPEFGDGESSERESQSSVTLLRRLSDELATLIRQELALASSEISRSLQTLLIGAASLAIGGAVIFMGMLALLAAAVLGLVKVWPAWLATVVIGAAVTLIGGVLVLLGVKSLKPSMLAPKRTAESLRRDTNVLMRSTRH